MGIFPARKHPAVVPQDFGQLRTAVDQWMSCAIERFDHDVEQLRRTGAFVPRLPDDLAERSARATRSLNLLVAAVPTPVRDSVARLLGRAEDIATEEALNPAVVTAEWLADRRQELMDLQNDVYGQII